MYRLLCTLALTVLLTVLLAPNCAAYEARFYAGMKPKDRNTFSEIMKVREAANRKLYCRTLDEIDVGLGKSQEFHPGKQEAPQGEAILETSGGKAIKRWPLYFHRDQIGAFLRNEKHKEFIVATFVNWRNTGSADILSEFNRFVDGLGYNRVLVLGSDPEGVYVLRDTQKKPPAKTAKTAAKTAAKTPVKTSGTRPQFTRKD